MDKKWFKAAGIRAIKTFAQTAVSLITIGATLKDIDWLTVGSASLVAAILSMLTSIAGLPELKDNTGGCTENTTEDDTEDAEG